MFGWPIYLSIFSLVLADYNVSLVSESDDQDINGKNLGFRSYGPLDCLFLQTSSLLTFSETTNMLYEPILVRDESGDTHVQKRNVSVFDLNAVSVDVANWGTPVFVDDGYLTFNDSSMFYTAKYDYHDPGQNTGKFYMLYVREDHGARPLKVKVVRNDANSSRIFSSSSSASVSSPALETTLNVDNRATLTEASFGAVALVVILLL